jgi:hypothetical protein
VTQSRTNPYSIFHVVKLLKPVPVAARAEVWTCGRLLVRIAGSSPSRGIDICRLGVLCFVMQSSLRRTDHSSRGVLASVVCLECDREAWMIGRPWPIKGSCAIGSQNLCCTYLQLEFTTSAVRQALLLPAILAKFPILNT